jgi:stearoyl-CoA desaturase (delta-9 desaturase)
MSEVVATADVVANAAAPAAGTPPWKRSWFYVAPGEFATFAWIASLHILAVAGLILLPLPSLPVVLVALFLLFMGGMGTTVAFHRMLSHRAVKMNPVVEQILIFFAVLNGSGRPITWVANHRLHHAYSDGPDDISSPAHGGFWWAHLRWLWQADQSPNQRFAKDLQVPQYRVWEHLQVPVLALSLFGGLAWPGADWREMLTAMLWIGPIRLVWALHAQCAVNSICHLGPVTSEHGSGRNIWWLAPFHLLQGENWHRNHHEKQIDPRLGKGLQIDLGWWTIQTLRVLRLAKIRGS